MKITFFRRLAVVPALALVALGLSMGTAQAAPGAYTCTGGSIPAGTYGSLSITGECFVDAGDVSVSGSVTVGVNGELTANDPASDFIVKGSLTADRANTVRLGCTSDCGEAHDTVGPTVTIGGNVSISRALVAVVEGAKIGGGLTISGNIGGCFLISAVVVDGNTVGGNVNITGNSSCVANFTNNQVTGSVNIKGNVTAYGEGPSNTANGNSIKGNLACTTNAPPVQAGGFPGGPNIVKGKTSGECLAQAN